MNKPVFYIILGLWLCVSFQFSIKAQENLVPNGSFEEYEWCPEGIADFSVSYWQLPSWGTSDYFHSCNIYSSGVPENFVGYQNAYTGFGYVGIGNCHNEPSVNSREFIYVELSDHLKHSTYYLFSMYVSLADSSMYCSSKIGIALSENISFQETTSVLPVTSYNLLYPSNVCDTSNWVKLSIVFLATGQEKFLTIGLFDTDDNLDLTVLNNNGLGCSYLYIDDVKLKPFSLSDTPNVFTPNNDGFNDIWNINLDVEFEISILDRWGNIVIDKTYCYDNYFIWDGQDIHGEYCNNGVYFYVIEVGDIFKNSGFIYLIR